MDGSDEADISLSKSKVDGSDEVVDCMCSPCLAESKAMAGDAFCVDCQDYYCKKCLDSHKRLPALSSHTLIPKLEFQTRMVGSTLQLVPTERCKQHPTKPIDLYCKTHQKVVCSTCVALDHTSCERHYIPDNISGLIETINMLEFMKTCKSATKATTESIEEVTNNIRKLNIVKGNVFKARQTFLNALKRYFDELERKDFSSLDKECTQLETRWSTHIADLKMLIETLSNYENKVNSATQNKSQQFVCMSLGMDILSCIKCKIAEIHPDVDQVTFIPNPKLTQLLESSIDFGTTELKFAQARQAIAEAKWKHIGAKMLPSFDSSIMPGVPIGSFVNDDCLTLSCANSGIFDASCTYQLNLLKGDVEGPFSPVSEPITTKEPAALRYLQLASSITCNDSSIKYLLPLTEIADARNDEAKTRKYELGKSEHGWDLKEKTIVLVGATGTGKTTLVDAILNYVLGVKWTDPYRFSIVHDEFSAHSSTTKQVLAEWITCYTIHPTAASMLQYSLTVIDTPGFGGRIQEDNRIVDQMQALCSEGSLKGIIGIDAICIVLKATDGPLTPAQNYIFERIMSLFGRNVISNICSFITFCDGTCPVVLDAMNDSKLPFGEHFKFNNSRLSVNEDTPENQKHFQMHYDMGFSSFSLFTEHLNTLFPVSLDDTREVLKQRRCMENTQHNLLPKLQVSLTMLQSIKKVIMQYRQYEMDADANKNFEYTKERQVHVVKNAPAGQNITNCTICNHTCCALDKSCSHECDEDKAKCVAMDGNGYCKECVGKCHWSAHKSTPYIYYLRTEPFTEVCLEKKNLFDIATGNLRSAQFDVEQKQKQYKLLQEEVKCMLRDLKKSHDQLKEMALCPVILSMENYIDLLIEVEKNDQKSDYEERVQELDVLKKEVLIKVNIKALHVEEEIVMKECISIAKM